MLPVVLPPLVGPSEGKSDSLKDGAACRRTRVQQKRKRGHAQRLARTLRVTCCTRKQTTLPSQPPRRTARTCGGLPATGAPPLPQPPAAACPSSSASTLHRVLTVAAKSNPCSVNSCHSASAENRGNCSPRTARKAACAAGPLAAKPPPAAAAASAAAAADAHWPPPAVAHPLPWLPAAPPSSASPQPASAAPSGHPSPLTAPLPRCRDPRLDDRLAAAPPGLNSAAAMLRPPLRATAGCCSPAAPAGACHDGARCMAAACAGTALIATASAGCRCSGCCCSQAKACCSPGTCSARCSSSSPAASAGALAAGGSQSCNASACACRPSPSSMLDRSTLHAACRGVAERRCGGCNTSLRRHSAAYPPTTT